MKLHIGVGLEPMLVLLVGVEVVEDDVKLAVRKSRGDAVHEVEKLDAATSFRMRRDDLSGGYFKRRKQRCRAVPLVVVSGRSRRGHWATSNSPALAPKPGSKASRPRIVQWPSRAERHRGQQHRRLWP